MEIRDVIHGSIQIGHDELFIIDSKFFQRLRQIKQLGFAEYSFPSATHNRYIHSLGAMQTASTAIETLFDNTPFLSHPKVYHHTYLRFRAILRLASLLHDIGHGPLSHTTEFAMPPAKSLNVPYKENTKNRKANHEDYTLKIILDSEITKLIDQAGAPFGFTAKHVAALIDPSIKIEDDFFDEKIDNQTVHFKTILQQLISSELDADRMDYLRRDSKSAGVSYGEFDFDWIISNLTATIEKGNCHLALQHRALYSFEDFLISRYHMFLMVYFHYKSVIYDEMLAKYFESDDCDYQIPSDIETYCSYNDFHLYSHLAKSKNPWAKRITEKTPYRILVELHSGIPASKSAHKQQQDLLNQVETDLNKKDIHYIRATSSSEFSKYFGKQDQPIYVKYDNYYSAPSFIPLEKCTDLFTKYNKTRSVTRVYVSPEDHPASRYSGRKKPLIFEEEIAKLPNL